VPTLAEARQREAMMEKAFGAKNPSPRP